MMRKKTQKQMGKNGYTLLFAVLVSALVLGVAVSILNISRKELILTTGARESNYAFYAADAGSECAIYLDTYGTGGSGTIFATTTTTGTTVSCGVGVGPAYTAFASPITVTGSSGNPYNFVFYMPIAGKACAAIDVTKTYNIFGVSSTTINSTGYNLGWSGTDCSGSNSDPEKVDRAIQISY